MAEVGSNERRLADRRQSSSRSKDPSCRDGFAPTCLGYSFDNLQSLPTPSSQSAASAKCHHVTLHENNVLAKRTHLTALLEKHKQRRYDVLFVRGDAALDCRVRRAVGLSENVVEFARLIARERRANQHPPHSRKLGGGRNGRVSTL